MKANAWSNWPTRKFPGLGLHQTLCAWHSLYCHRTNRSVKICRRKWSMVLPTQGSPSHAKEANYSYRLWTFRCVSINRTFQKAFLANIFFSCLLNRVDRERWGCSNWSPGSRGMSKKRNKSDASLNSPCLSSSQCCFHSHFTGENKGKAWFPRSPKECRIWISKAVGVRSHSTLSVSRMHFYASTRLSNWEKSTEIKL